MYTSGKDGCGEYSTTYVPVSMSTVYSFITQISNQNSELSAALTGKEK